MSQQQGPLVPPRVSSKQALDDMRDSLSARSNSLRSEIETQRKKLKHSGSFDSLSWTDAGNVVEKELEKTDIDQELFKTEFLQGGGKEEEWEASPKRSSLDARKRALLSKLPLLREQASRTNLSSKSQGEAIQRTFVTLFTTSVAGLKVQSPHHRSRDNSLQSNFRTALLDSYNLRGKGPRHRLVWDVVLHHWAPPGSMTASHLFASRFGADTMVAIFGKDVQDELFAPENGLILNNDLEKLFEDGFFVIVPDLPDNPTPEARTAWRQGEPKEYKIKFIDKPTESWVPGGKTTAPEKHRYNDNFMEHMLWRDLDGRKLQFRNQRRPRARYLYFVFCLNLLRFAWRYEKHATEILEPELSKFYWGSPKRYVRETMLPGFVKEIGHRYENVFEDPEGAEDCEVRNYGEGSDDLLREAATSQVLMNTGAEGEGEDDDDEESSSEGESEGEN